jgi:hypothetical protein
MHFFFVIRFNLFPFFFLHVFECIQDPIINVEDDNNNNNNSNNQSINQNQMIFVVVVEGDP